MQYILLILLIILGLYKLTQFIDRRMEKRDNDNRDRHTKEQLKYYKGMQINGKGKLIEMDSHFDGILNNEQ